MAHETIVDSEAENAVISAGMLADRLRPLVLASCDQGDTGSSCMNNGPFVPIHRATLSAIYQHLERIAAWDGERTILSLECELRSLRAGQSKRIAEAEEKLVHRNNLARQCVEQPKTSREHSA
jgi:hypothetical protein